MRESGAVSTTEMNGEDEACLFILKLFLVACVFVDSRQQRKHGGHMEAERTALKLVT